MHTWRKRLKELRYGFELLRVKPTPAWVREQLRAHRELARALGEVTDLLILREYAHAHHGFFVPAEFDALSETLNAEIDVRTRACLERAKPLFAEKPDAYARQAVWAIWMG